MSNELPCGYTFNTELPRVNQLIPQEIRIAAANFVSFLEEYYRYTNSPGQTSNVLAKLLKEKDIDYTCDDVFFQAIQREIAKSIPNSNVFDRQTLYKRILDYYSTRGSEASVIGFFKIFYNQVPQIYYPKDDLLRPSDGNYKKATGTYANRNGFLSDSKRLQDSYYWQDFSYVIKSEVAVNTWENSFLKLVHPAGMKVFGNLEFIISNTNTWTSTISYSANESSIGTWFIAPPTYGSHSPVSQPGWLTNGLRTNVLYSPDYIESIISDDTYHTQYPYAYGANTSLNVYTTSYADVSLGQIFYNDYQQYLKFYDSTPISDYGNITVNYATTAYSPIRIFPPKALGSIVTTTTI